MVHSPAQTVLEPRRKARGRTFGWIATALAVAAAATACGAGGSGPPAGPPPAASPAVATATPPLEDGALVTALRAGGYVIYLRHGATDSTTKDAAAVNLADCATQRRLSATGQAQARQVGQAVAALRLPVADLRTSPYCRVATTARLAFPTVAATPDPALVPVTGPGVTPTEQQAAILHLLSTPPPAGGDTVLIGHGDSMQAATRVPEAAEGGAEIYQPRPGQPPLLVARLDPAGWTTLAHTHP